MTDDSRDKAAEHEATESAPAGLVAESVVHQATTTTPKREVIVMAPVASEVGDRSCSYTTFVIDSYGPLIFAVQKQCSCSKQDAQEAVHAALVKVVSRLRRGTRIDNPYAYTLKTALRCFSAGKHKTEGETCFHEDREPSATGVTPEEEALTIQCCIERSQLMAAAHKCIKSLPKQQRQVTMMKLEGASSSEIAKNLGISKKTVATHWQRARLQIMKQVNSVRASLKR